MPWKRVDVADQRLQFAIRAASGKERMSSLCREFGIARPTGYRWRGRYREGGSFTAVQERSRRPRRSPRRIDEEKQLRVVSWRQQTGWGAKKLQVVLREQEGMALPLRTIHRILKRQGLVSPEAHAAAYFGASNAPRMTHAASQSQLSRAEMSRVRLFDASESSRDRADYVSARQGVRPLRQGCATSGPPPRAEYRTRRRFAPGP